MPGAPYDARNEADYKELTQRISAALERMASDPLISATEKGLAKLAKCSRGTLRKRELPLVRLKLIKKKRKEDAEKKSKEVTCGPKSEVEVHLEDKKKLLEQLGKSRAECAKWVSDFRELEGKYKRAARANEVLQEERERLQQKVAAYAQKIKKLTEDLERERAKNVVVPFKERLSKAEKQPPSPPQKKIIANLG